MGGPEIEEHKRLRFGERYLKRKNLKAFINRIIAAIVWHLTISPAFTDI